MEDFISKKKKEKKKEFMNLIDQNSNLRTFDIVITLFFN